MLIYKKVKRKEERKFRRKDPKKRKEDLMQKSLKGSLLDSDTQVKKK